MKCSLKSIVLNDLNQETLFGAVMRTHRIVIHAYQMLRLWILKKYNDKEKLPLITTHTIAMAFKALMLVNPRGGKTQGNNLVLYNEFKKFFDDEYKHLYCDGDKINGTNLSRILGFMETDMITNIENNIKMHFIKYVKLFVNSSFKKQNNDLLSVVRKGNENKFKKRIK